MRELRHLLGYVFGIGVFAAALCVGLNAVASEVFRYVLTYPSDRSPSQKDMGSEVVSVRKANAQPVWIAPTPRYQYDPKLMEMKPPHQLRREADIRRKNEQTKFKEARDAKVRKERNLSVARSAFAQVRDVAPPPSFLMFSPH